MVVEVLRVVGPHEVGDLVEPGRVVDELLPDRAGLVELLEDHPFLAGGVAHADPPEPALSLDVGGRDRVVGRVHRGHVVGADRALQDEVAVQVEQVFLHRRQRGRPGRGCRRVRRRSWPVLDGHSNVPPLRTGLHDGRVRSTAPARSSPKLQSPFERRLSSRDRIDGRTEPRTGRHDQVPVDELDRRCRDVGGVETRSDVVGRERQRRQHRADVGDRGRPEPELLGRAEQDARSGGLRHGRGPDRRADAAEHVRATGSGCRPRRGAGAATRAAARGRARTPGACSVAGTRRVPRVAAQRGALDEHHVGDRGQPLGRLEGLAPSQDVREVERLDPDSAGEPVGESAS